MNPPPPSAPAAASVATTRLAGKYLTFLLKTESYAVDVRKVREIVRMPGITWVPQMPEFVRGVINLRGKIVPVLDLRLRFGLPDPGLDEHTCVVVVQLRLGSERAAFRETGLIVDAVEEVTQLAAEDIEATPDFGPGVDTGYILGISRSKGIVRLLLDIDLILAPEDALTLRESGSSNPTPAS